DIDRNPSLCTIFLKWSHARYPIEFAVADGAEYRPTILYVCCRGCHCCSIGAEYMSKPRPALAPELPLDDHSGDFYRVRGGLQSSAGVRYVDFVPTLQPSYVRVWFDIAVGYLALAGTMAAAAVASGPWRVIADVVACISVGYWIAYLHLFVHEAAHFN